jgi:hypothetical protein
MRSLIAIVAIASLTAGAALAQYDAKPANPTAAQTKPATPPAGTAAALTEPQAKARIEAQGFTNVSELKKDAKGVWTAKATKDGKSVDLSLNTQGLITQHN